MCRFSFDETRGFFRASFFLFHGMRPAQNLGRILSRILVIKICVGFLQLASRVHFEPKLRLTPQNVGAAQNLGRILNGIHIPKVEVTTADL